jgi:hypothetical protein
MQIGDPVVALQLDQALYLRLATDEREPGQANAHAPGAKGRLPAGLRHETLADLPPDPGDPHRVH